MNNFGGKCRSNCVTSPIVKYRDKIQINMSGIYFGAIIRVQ